jgi:hypothetical protein
VNASPPFFFCFFFFFCPVHAPALLRFLLLKWP